MDKIMYIVKIIDDDVCSECFYDYIMGYYETIDRVIEDIIQFYNNKLEEYISYYYFKLNEVEDIINNKDNENLKNCCPDDICHFEERDQEFIYDINQNIKHMLNTIDKIEYNVYNMIPINYKSDDIEYTILINEARLKC